MDLNLLIAKGLKVLLNPPALRACKIDKTSKVCSRSELSNVQIGRFSYVGNQCFMVNVTIGSFCSIADRCCIGGALHPMDRVSTSPVFHEGKNVLRKNFASFPKIHTPQTVIENDVWLGIGCCVKSGITIHSGAIIGMGSVVTHNIPPYEVWAGNPARKIRDRFDDEVVDMLLKSEWWNFSEEELMDKAQYFDDIKRFARGKG